jgi:hypothetical protein
VPVRSPRGSLFLSGCDDPPEVSNVRTRTARNIVDFRGAAFGLENVFYDMFDLAAEERRGDRALALRGDRQPLHLRVLGVGHRIEIEGRFIRFAQARVHRRQRVALRGCEIGGDPFVLDRSGLVVSFGPA